MSGGLTDVPGIEVGHDTDLVGWTGCTAILCPAGAVGGVEIRGGASGVLGLDLLDPRHVAERLHGVVLAGGSAFGLEAVFGVMEVLERRGIGFPTSAGRVPLVAGAILYDLGVGDPDARPDRAMGARAARAAGPGPVAEGSVGAGTGATVGKLLGRERAMKGGLGTASRRIGPATVGALVAVNAAGDVRDPSTGALVAGARDAPAGRGLADCAARLRAGALAPAFGQGTHTTLAVVATDAALTKAEARRLAGWAHVGLAAVLSPPQLTVDGDTAFALSTGDHRVSVDVLGLAAADAVQEAVLRGVRAAEGRAGFPACRDLAAPPA